MVRGKVAISIDRKEWKMAYEFCKEWTVPVLERQIEQAYSDSCKDASSGRRGFTGKERFDAYMDELRNRVSGMEKSFLVKALSVNGLLAPREFSRQVIKEELARREQMELLEEVAVEVKQKQQKRRI